MGNQSITVSEGKHTIDVQTLKKDADEPSAMAEYLGPSAICTNHDEALYLTIMLESQHIITGFQIENEADEPLEAIDTQIIEETNKRFEMFELERLTHTMAARVQYDIEHEGQNIKGDEALRLFFDDKTLEKIR